MDFGSCSEASYVVSMDGFASVEEGECCFPYAFVVFAKFVEVLDELGDFV